MNQRYIPLVFAALVFAANTGSAQVLNKLKNKTEQKTGDAIDNLLSGKKKNQTQNAPAGGNDSSKNEGQNQSPTNSKQTNKGGGGLISTPPDVNQNLADAEAAYKKSSYGEARYAVQQAMLGIELEIGNKILKSLPESISGMAKNDEYDQVTSTGYGWAGLTIQRQFNDANDKQLNVTVANNSVWMAGVNAYLANGGYAQQTNGEQNWKQTKLKGYRAIIEYDESSGYKLSVPLGQSSLIVYEAINFATEQEVMKAAEVIDLDGIKKMLGEQ